MDKIQTEIENGIKTDVRNGDFDKKENIRCDHQCSGNCRREGCNCECGEFHYSGEEEGYCKTCNAIIGDGHDCDNCAFCGTEPMERDEEDIAEDEAIRTVNAYGL